MQMSGNCTSHGAMSMKVSMAGMLQSKERLSVDETTLVNIEMVGRYGLTPVWEDGHKTGIYTYEKLRALCECEECTRKRTQSQNKRG
jgi:DUF971 family protein